MNQIAIDFLINSINNLRGDFINGRAKKLTKVTIDFRLNKIKHDILKNINNPTELIKIALNLITLKRLKIKTFIATPAAVLQTNLIVWYIYEIATRQEWRMSHYEALWFPELAAVKKYLNHKDTKLAQALKKQFYELLNAND